MRLPWLSSAPSPPAAHWTGTIPEDIIHEIIGRFDGDIKTLKACALVSRSFSLISRKYIFSVVKLNSPSKVRKLHKIMTKELGTFVVDLSITLDEKDTTTLPRFLRWFTHLRRLAIGSEQSVVRYTRCPVELRSALEDLLASSSLDTLTFTSIFEIPASVFCTLFHVRMLGMSTIVISPEISEHAPPHAPPMQLECFHLSNVASSGPWPFANTPRVRRLSVVVPDIQQPSLNTVKNAIEAGAKSIQDFVWIDINISPLITSLLDGILDLRRLSFIIEGYNRITTSQANTKWLSIIEILKRPAIGENLEELNIVLRYETESTSWLPTSASPSIWADLDSMLVQRSKFPSLRTVSIYNEIAGFDESLSSIELTKHQLPLVYKGGMLHTELRGLFEWQILD